MSIFDFSDYKTFVLAWIDGRPKNGWGELAKMAKALGVHTTMLSHTIKADKHLSMEQAYALCEYMRLKENETDYFLALISRDRAGTHALKLKYEKQISSLKSHSKVLEARMPKEREITEEQKAIFYSNWLYSAVHLAAELPDIKSPVDLLQYFHDRPSEEINKILVFLMEIGFVIDKDGLKIGPRSTHLGQNSPWIYTHHKNWRVKAFERHGKLTSDELMYSGQLTISHEGFLVFRERITKLLEELATIANTEKPQKLAALNIDWILL